MIDVLRGDCRQTLDALEPGSAQAVITSPPYYGLRAYGTPPLVWGQSCCDHPHEWGEAGRGPWAGKVPSAKSATIRNTAYHASMSKEAGQVCSHVHEFGLFTDVRQFQVPPGAAKQASNAGSVAITGESRVCRCGAWLGSLGLEPTPELYLEHLVECLRHVRRVLRDDGVAWVNLGDSYSSGGRTTQSAPAGTVGHPGMRNGMARRVPSGVAKEKDLLLIPFRAAVALQADGWYVRSVIPWLKHNGMPESVRDRPSNSLEYVLLLAKSSRYYYDVDSVRVSAVSLEQQHPSYRPNAVAISHNGRKEYSAKHARSGRSHTPDGRNRRNTDWFFESWQGLLLDDDDPLAFVVNPAPYKGAHYATFPPRLIEPMLRASTSDRGQCARCAAPWVRVSSRQSLNRRDHGAVDAFVDLNDGRAGDPEVSTTGWRASCRCTPSETVPQTVLDPFGGAGTVGLVADRLGRHAVLCELSDTYTDQSTQRLTAEAPLFAEVRAS